ncbi:MAG: cell wall hydrolase [Halanaerobiales bacterium]|nr:cell wall hydrolase [Halanaerobiales bacterium]
MKNTKIIILIFFMIILLFNNTGYTQPRFRLIYVVQKGDTIYDLANDYKMTVSHILVNNHIEDASKIDIGDELVIKKEKEDINTKSKELDYSLNLNKESDNDFRLDVGRNYSIRYNPDQPLPNINNIPPGKIIKYYVNSGDTLYDLALSFNTSVGVIMALNDMENSIIRKGETLKLPIFNLTKRQVLAKTVNQSDIELMARTIYGEARGEPYMGQVAVGAVIINRILNNDFPDTIKGVIYQNNQFTAVSNGQINYTPNSTAYKAAREALNGIDPTMGSLYYYNPKTAKNKSWFDSRKFIVSIGQHVFAK